VKTLNLIESYLVYKGKKTVAFSDADVRKILFIYPGMNRNVITVKYSLEKLWL